MKKRIIIIGSGIGSCGVGALLSKDFEIIILEKNAIVGKRAATYEKDGFKMDVGGHLFAEGAKGPLSEICKNNTIQS